MRKTRLTDNIIRRIEDALDERKGEKRRSETSLSHGRQERREYPSRRHSDRLPANAVSTGSRRLYQVMN